MRVTIELADNDLDALDRLAEVDGTSRQEAIRAAIVDWIDARQPVAPPPTSKPARSVYSERGLVVL